MTIRKKTLLLIGITLSTFIMIQVSASYVVVFKRFEGLERERVQDQIIRFRNKLTETLNNLEATCSDWAPWDDTYDFIDNNNPEYIQNNLVDSTFENLRLNFMIFFKDDGEIAYSHFYVLNQDSPTMHQEKILDEIKRRPRLTTHKTPEDHVAAIIVVDKIPFLVASNPIVTSDYKGPIRGTMIMGRMLDAIEISKISIGINTPLKLYDISKLPSFFPADTFIPVMASEGKELVLPLDRKTIFGYTSIADVDGAVVLLGELASDRQITKYGRFTWRLNTAAMVGLGVISLVLLIYLLDHTLLNRLTGLSRQVGHLATSGQFTDRIKVKKRDEIGNLEQSINTLLDTIQKFHELQIEYEAQYRAVVEDQNELICRLDKNLEIVFLNGAFSRYFNTPKESTIGRKIETIIPGISPWILQRVGIGDQSEKLATHQLKINNYKGETHWLRWQMRTIVNASGQKSGYQLVGQDLTDQIVAETILHENEQYLRQLLDSINCGVMVVDKNTRKIIDVNITGAKLLKRDRDHVIGQVCHRHVCPKEVGDCPVIDHDQIIDLSERNLLKSDGTILPILKSVTTIERNGHPFLVESFIDISRLVQTETELRLSEERYRRFFEEDLTGDLLTSADGQIIDCNPALAKMLGYDRVEEVIAMNILNFHKSGEQRHMVLDRLRREAKIERIQLEFVHRNKQPLYVIGNLTGYFDEQGKLEQIMSYFFDDTKRILLENDQRRAHKMEAIGTLAGGIAHDFNNILSGIMGYTEIVLAELPSTKNTAELLDKSLAAAIRAKELIKQILTFSRQTESENKPVKIAAIINEVYNLIRASLPTTIQISKNLVSEATVMADPSQIHQVIMNLCTNAGYAMKNKGGRLTITLDEIDVENPIIEGFNDIPPGKYVRIQIEDTGEGIPDKIIDRIFDPFFTTKDQATGTGLGLSVVHGIVTKAGGAIKVTTSSTGSRFDVFLPSNEDKIEVPTREINEIPKGHETIVLIDDEEFIVEIETQMLSMLGYTVIGFTKASKALDYLAEKSDEVNLVVTDMTMPELTGIALTEQLLKIAPQMPVILSTGYNNQLNSSQLSRLGIGGLVKKPVQMNDLAITVRKVLDSAEFNSTSNL